MQYKVKKTCTLPGSLRFVEAGEVINEADLQGQKPPKHLEAIPEKPKPAAEKPAEQTSKAKPAAGKKAASQSAEAGQSKQEDLSQKGEDKK